MDSFFGIGIAELFFIALIALVVLGPERLPGAIREVTKTIRYVRNLTNELTSQFSEEMKVMDELNPQKLLRELTEDPEETKKPAPKSGAMAKKPATTKPATTKPATAKPASPAKPATARKVGTPNDAPKPVVKPKTTDTTEAAATNNVEPAASPELSEETAPHAGDTAAETPATPEPTILPPHAEADATPSDAPQPAAAEAPAPADEGEIVVETASAQPSLRVNGAATHGNSKPAKGAAAEGDA